MKTTVWQPDIVPSDLILLTRRLGAPEADLALLAEGNVSTRLPDGRLAVKVSGARMGEADAEAFVIVDPAALVPLFDGVGTQDELDDMLLSDRPGGRTAASLETLVHIAATVYGGAAWVAHTHPTSVVGLLSVDGAHDLWAAPLFPDEAVMLGTPVWIPYWEPGLSLGRACAAALRESATEGSARPRLMLLGNHGIVALGSTVAEVEAVTAMAVKAARVRTVALATGRPMVSLEAHHAEALSRRPDEVARRETLGKARQ